MPFFLFSSLTLDGRRGFRVSGECLEMEGVRLKKEYI
jgi:hypothetical protein